MASALTALAGRLAQLPNTINEGVTKGTTAAAEVVRLSVVAASGKYAGRPIARVRVYPGHRTAAGMSQLVAMTNRKAHLLDHDTKAASILPGAVTGRRGRKRALGNPQTGFGPVASAVRPPTRGKFMWEKGVAMARPKVSVALEQNVTAGMLRLFRQ